MPEGDMEVANWGYVCADDNDIPYLNFVYEDLDINYATDCMDESHHLNMSGAKKVTDYIGKYLLNNYNITDKRKVSEYNFWYTDYEEYKADKIKWLGEQQNDWEYLVMLNDRDFYVRIYADENSSIYSDNELIELVGNISVFGTVELLPEYGEYRGYDYVVETYDSATDEILNVRMVEWR
jgi:hypothetical protein